MNLSNKLMVKKFVKLALEEDIWHGDITVEALIKENQQLRVRLNSRSETIIAGLDVVKTLFKILDPEINFNALLSDGDTVKPNQDIAIIEGDAAAILTGERTALNFIQRMSAIATLTNAYQRAIAPYKAKITDTRKTTPNFRIFEKYSVKVGGGSPHRFGLCGCVMIKDNHIKLAGGLTEAIRLAKEDVSHTVKIEAETENLKQVKEAVDAGVDIIMLDNMPFDDIKEAVKMINNKAIIEVSGNVTLENVNQIASTGVDYISTSAITAQAGIIDMGLDI